MINIDTFFAPLLKDIQNFEYILSITEVSTGIYRVLTDNLFDAKINDYVELTEGDLLGTFQIIAINNTNFTFDIKATTGLTIVNGGFFTIKKPILHIGTLREVNQRRINMKSGQKYPFIVINEPIKQKDLLTEGFKPFAYQSEIEIRAIFVLDSINYTDTNQEIRTNVMENLTIYVNKFLNFLKNNTISYEVGDTTEYNRLGKDDANGYNGLQFNEHLAGYLLKNVKLKINPLKFCKYASR